LGIPPYVVRITGLSEAGQDFTGTGLIVSPRGHIATCRHVVVHDSKPAKEIWIHIPNQPKPWPYILMDQSEKTDLAVLEGLVPPTHDTSFATLHPHWHRDAQIGQEVAICGHSSANNYPHGQRYSCSISGFSEADGLVGIVGSINPGDSGGPVLDDKERVIGVIHVRDRTRTGQARFVPASRLISLLDKNEVPFQFAARIKGESDATLTHNPFIWRQGIGEAEAFFDREAEQRRLRDIIHTHQTCQIVGPRRIGKTSLLLELERSLHKWETKARVAYIDLHSAHCYTLSGWLAWVSEKFSWTQTATSLTEFNKRVEEMIKRSLIPVLLLDEFGAFTRRRNEFNEDFFWNLRSCAGTGMPIITASQKFLNELTDPEDPTSPYYNIFSPLELGPFSDEDMDDFLARSNMPRFDTAEQEAIKTFSKGNPLDLQVACFHVVECRSKGGPLKTALQRARRELKAYYPATTRR
jgi:hypothetical protein